MKHLKVASALALGLCAASCGSNVNLLIGDGDGVPLGDLDMSGAAPTKLMLAGPDTVVVSEGDRLAITVSGDAQAIDKLRFTLEDGSLGIAREDSDKTTGKATIAVTMPRTEEIMLAGSGDIRAPAMSAEAEIAIAGSGNVVVAKVAAERFAVNMMGSGTLTAAGTAERLDFNVAGSGKLAARQLKVSQAEVNIAGSGEGEFASDGRVAANVAGSGEVTVYGRAECKISAMGSGRLRCVDGGPGQADGAASAAGAPRGPAPPAPPAGPAAE